MVDLVHGEPDEVEVAGGDAVAPVVVVLDAVPEADIAVVGGVLGGDQPQRLGLRARQNELVAGHGGDERQILVRRLVAVRGRVTGQPALHLRIREVPVQRIQAAAQRAVPQDIAAHAAPAHPDIDRDVVRQDIAPGVAGLAERALDLGEIRP